MNIHEYQAKNLFESYGVPIPKGFVAQTDSEIDEALSQLPDHTIVVKSQIHAGGRGKGTFTDGYKGGVKLVENRSAAKEVASHMLGNTLVTAQTGPDGRKVQTLYFTEVSDIAHEYYLAIVLDRETAQAVIIASTEGGMDIETVAEETPEKIIKEWIDPAVGLQGFQARKVAFALGLEGAAFKGMVKFIFSLYKA